ncbi:MAG: methyltransferase domain-containing protein [Kiritimatiellae bacterium]|nr:methyltransferase domain-containing protein [Kiritimatiellia bacterium]
MNKNQDAYGRALLDFYEGKGGYEIVERDDGHVGLSGGPPAYLQPPAKWAAHIRKALRHAGKRVLDIGCGAGRHALYLQARGARVTGIDVSSRAVRVCRMRGLKDARVLPITRVSPKLGTFDTIVMFGNNFGLFGGFRQARRLLKRLHAMTTDDAALLVESTDPYDTTRPCHLAYHRLNRRRGRMPGQLRIRVRYETWATPWFDYLLVSRDEMKEILQGTGWRVRKFYDSAGSAYAAVIEKAPARSREN